MSKKLEAFQNTTQSLYASYNIPEKATIDWKDVIDCFIGGATIKQLVIILDIPFNKINALAKKELNISITRLHDRIYERINVLLRQAQLEAALTQGDVSLLTWLGKTRLKQTPAVEEHKKEPPVFNVISFTGKPLPTFKDLYPDAHALDKSKDHQTGVSAAET